MSPISEEEREPESPKSNRFRTLFSWVFASTLFPFARVATNSEPKQSSIDLAQIQNHEDDHLQDQNQVLTYLLLSDTEEALVTTTKVTANPPQLLHTEGLPELVDNDSIPPYPPLLLSLSGRYASSSVSSLSSSSSAIFDREESIPSAPLSPNYNKIQTTAPVVVQFSAMETEAEPPHPVVEIIDGLELGKNALVLAIAMLTSLIAIYNIKLSLDNGMLAVALILTCVFATIQNGVLLRNSYPTASIVILVVRFSLMLFALFAYLGWILPIKLAAIPAVSFLASLFPFYLVIRDLIYRKKVGDVEMGDIQELT